MYVAPWLGALCVLSLLVDTATAYKTGAPDNEGICKSMTPGHTLKAQKIPAPFEITVSEKTYTTSSVLKVTINATTVRKFRGLLIIAKRVNPNLDTTESIGYFDNIDGTQIVCTKQNGYGLTHKGGNPGSDVEKSSMELTWTAPNPSQNHIQFWVTIVSDFDTYWVRERSVVIMDENAGPLPSTAPPKETPQKLMIEPIVTDGCGKTKGCYRNPKGCSELMCHLLVTWRDEGDYIDFELSADSEGWVAVGFSEDKKMGNDDVYECVLNNKEVVEVKHSYNPKDERYNVQTDDGGYLSNVESERSDGRIRCRFRRAKTIDRAFAGPVDFADFTKEYHILLARGTVDENGNKERHVLEPNKYPYVSKQKLKLTNDVDIDSTARYFLVKIHGCLMLIAWMMCAPVALIMAKYYKPMWPNDYLCKEKVWFAVHRGCMLVTLLCTVIGFILIFVHAWGYSRMPDLPDKAHPILGIIVTICTVINPLLALCRCNPKSSYRPIFNWIHWFFGTIGSVLAVPALFIGLNLHKAFVPWWATWVMVAFMLFHLIIELMLEIHGCVNAKKQKYRSEEYEMRKKGVDSRGDYYGIEQEPVGTRFKKRILAVYLVVAIILGIVMVITVAAS